MRTSRRTTRVRGTVRHGPCALRSRQPAHMPVVRAAYRWFHRRLSLATHMLLFYFDHVFVACVQFLQDINHALTLHVDFRLC